MANSAAKKAAAAKKGASSIYLPILVGFNVLHCMILYVRGLLSSSSYYYRLFVTLVQWIITYVSYQGILQDSQHFNLTKNRKDQLSGGFYLDILGVVMLSQLGGWVFPGYIHLMDSLLIVLPTVYVVYKWVSPKMINFNQSLEETSPQDAEAKKALEERRRLRAERRRQKRM
jgi:hypothetical protein